MEIPLRAHGARPYRNRATCACKVEVSKRLITLLESRSNTGLCGAGKTAVQGRAKPHANVHVAIKQRVECNRFYIPHRSTDDALYLTTCHLL